MVSIDRLEQFLSEHWPKVEGHGPNNEYDLVADDGTFVVQVKKLSGSTRDLHAALLQLAVALEENESIRRGYLVAHMPRMTAARASDEWKRVRRVLRADVGERLGLIALGANEVAALPEDDERAAELASWALAASEQDETLRHGPKWRPSEKFFDVWKVLLAAWLSGEGFLKVGEVARRAGCSYPTVAKAFDHMMERREVERDSSRSVRLRGFPRESLSQLLVLSESLRKPIRFIDGTGRRPDPQALLRRLEKKRPSGVAFGGVVAARHHDPYFDLNGLPRLDLVMTEPIDVRWVRSVDPALRQASQKGTEPVLVIRRTSRAESGFVESGEHELPVADAAETLLDLYELRLNQQAEDLVRTLRGQGDHR